MLIMVAIDGGLSAIDGDSGLGSDMLTLNAQNHSKIRRLLAPFHRCERICPSPKNIHLVKLGVKQGLAAANASL